MSKPSVHFHDDYKCSRFTDFSISRGKTLVSSIKDIVCKKLPSYMQIPSVVWEDDADVDGSLACQALPCIEKFLSAPMFFMETEAISDYLNFSLSYTIEHTIKQRCQEVSQGKMRWRFQDEFDTIQESMQTDGRVTKVRWWNWP